MTVSKTDRDAPTETNARTDRDDARKTAPEEESAEPKATSEATHKQLDISTPPTTERLPPKILHPPANKPVPSMFTAWRRTLSCPLREVLVATCRLL